MIHYDGGTSHHQAYPGMTDRLAGRAAATDNALADPTRAHLG